MLVKSLNFLPFIYRMKFFCHKHRLYFYILGILLCLIPIILLVNVGFAYNDLQKNKNLYMHLPKQKILADSEEVLKYYGKLKDMQKNKNLLATVPMLVKIIDHVPIYSQFNALEITDKGFMLKVSCADQKSWFNYMQYLREGLKEYDIRENNELQGKNQLVVHTVTALFHQKSSSQANMFN